MWLNQILVTRKDLLFHYLVKRVLNYVLWLVGLALIPAIKLTLFEAGDGCEVVSLERYQEHDSQVGVNVVPEEAIVHHTIPVLDVFIRVAVLVEDPIGVEVHVLGAVADEKFVEDLQSVSKAFLNWIATGNIYQNN